MVFTSWFSRLFCKRKKFSIFIALLNLFVLSSIYYSVLSKQILQKESHLNKGQPQLEERKVVAEVHHESLFPIHGNPNGDKESDRETVASKFKLLPRNEVTDLPLRMEGCPLDWPHEVIRNDSAGIPVAQVCRNKNGNGQWRCAKGWKRVGSDPFCVRVVITPVTDLFWSSIEENHETQSLRQFVSENSKLLFYQLPGIGVEISPSVFRVLRENETFDQSRLEDYHKFTFIMHPCLRLIKMWEALVSHAVINVSFTSFVNGLFPSWKSLLLFDEDRLKPQAEILFDNNRQVSLDQILEFERWDESLLELIKRTKIGWKRVHFLRARSPNDTQCSRLYTQETWLKMANSYAMDFCVFKYSTNVTETHIMPQLDFTIKALTSRYNACSQNSTDRDTSLHVHSSSSVATSLNPCTIHTYYQPANDTPKDILATQNALKVWEKIWASAGWRTRVLNESNAMLHPDYEYLRENFQSLHTIDAKMHKVGDYIRHVAMATVGGGWLADYNTLPLHFPLCFRLPFNGSFTLWSGSLLALVSGRGDEYTRVAHLIAKVGHQRRANPDLFVESNRLLEDRGMKILSFLVKEDHVKSFRVLIEMSDYSHGGFSCNKTNFPQGMPFRPWGVHLSNSFMRYMTRRNSTLSSNLSSATQRSNPSIFFRQTFMEYVYNIYLETCYL